ncbi:MAG: hypothetical protein NHB14_17690 [Desulfosporosinus sp.]|nr:hypothetical protein [Desulfosporosinus sp.]
MKQNARAKGILSVNLKEEPCPNGGAHSSRTPFYEDTRINEELDNAYQRIQEQNRKLERSLTIHQELYRLVLRSEDLTGITETISQIFKGSVLLFDSTLKELAAKSDTPTNLIKEVKNILTKKYPLILSQI